MIVLIFPGEKLAQGLALLEILGCGIGQAINVRRHILAAGAHRAILLPEPTSPVAGLELLVFVALGARVQQHKVRNRAIQMAKLLRQYTSDSRPREGCARLCAALQQVDRLKVFGLFRLHRADDGKLIRDTRALRHQAAKVDAWNLRWNALEWTAVDAFRLGIPGLELAGSTAEPQQYAVLLLPFD